MSVVDALRRPEPAIEYEIRAMPALLLFTPDGAVRASYGDLSDCEALEHFFTQPPS